ncbi:MAG TPA: DUF4905 domain-containing protein [Chryseosolibacter sp.]
MHAPLNTIHSHSSLVFSGTVWKTLADEESGTIFIESRDSQKKNVSFSAWRPQSNEWLWKDLQFEEEWWISLGYVKEGVVLFTLYSDTDNPDKKSLVAVDVLTQKIKWWKNNFVVAYLAQGTVVGQDTKFGSREIALDLFAGNEIVMPAKENDEPQNFAIVRPLQYIQGTEHFETVKRFIERKCQFTPVDAIEYREYESLIVISAFERQTDLANYLIVFNSEGDIVLKEQLGENLKGIAYDTFFIFRGFLIFVKNKRELISYRFV